MALIVNYAPKAGTDMVQMTILPRVVHAQRESFKTQKAQLPATNAFQVHFKTEKDNQNARSVRQGNT